VIGWQRLEQRQRPHLRRGEYAVIDTSDRDLQHGELYLDQSNSGPRRRSIVQAKIDRTAIADDDPHSNGIQNSAIRRRSRASSLSWKNATLHQQPTSA
jgi:hypothetical protein